MIAYCGLNCNTCPIHLATIELDQMEQQTMRESIAELCTKQYGMNLRPEEITDCDGCCAKTGRLFSGCWDCEIRKCASQKHVESCAFCEDYLTCHILQEHFAHDPEAKMKLDDMRRKS